MLGKQRKRAKRHDRYFTAEPKCPVVKTNVGRKKDKLIVTLKKRFLKKGSKKLELALICNIVIVFINMLRLILDLPSV